MCIRDRAEHIRVIGNAEIAAHLTLFDIGGVDHDHDFSLLFELKEHINLAAVSYTHLDVYKRQPLTIPVMFV